MTKVGRDQGRDPEAEEGTLALRRRVCTCVARPWGRGPGRIFASLRAGGAESAAVRRCVAKDGMRTSGRTFGVT